ncbi:spherulation-specific family 4 protein [Pseudonocardia sp.]|uniref:spherulation-specific family 4 protein n=1 Tax=Pseudonocardia sp. TaxID=60912 RepID=UPI003D14505E
MTVIDLAVPAYFHPAREAADWVRLCATAPLGLVVVNPCSGAGTAADPAYRPVCAALRARPEVIVAGYVDTAYGTRPAADVLTEAVRYERFYGIGAVFLDQVSSGADALDHYVDVVGRLRASGAAAVVLNPGVAPHPGYRALADVVVTFEGPWSAYRGRAPDPPGPGRTCHLVHATPDGRRAAAWRRARSLGADLAYVTARGLPNPWDGFA